MHGAEHLRRVRCGDRPCDDRDFAAYKRLDTARRAVRPAPAHGSARAPARGAPQRAGALEQGGRLGLRGRRGPDRQRPAAGRCCCRRRSARANRRPPRATSCSWARGTTLVGSLHLGRASRLTAAERASSRRCARWRARCTGSPARRSVGRDGGSVSTARARRRGRPSKWRRWRPRGARRRPRGGVRTARRGALVAATAWRRPPRRGRRGGGGAAAAPRGAGGLMARARPAWRSTRARREKRIS